MIVRGWILIGVGFLALDVSAGAEETRRVDVHLFGGGSPQSELALIPWYHEIGITDVWLYPLNGAFPQDQPADTQMTVDQLRGAGTLNAYVKHAVRYWWFERPVPDFAYETFKKPDKPDLNLWGGEPEVDKFWSEVCARITTIYPEARKAGFAGLAYDNEAYYSYKGDEKGAEKPWVWGGHEKQYGPEGNYHKRGLQVAKAIQSVWPGAKVIMVYAYGYEGERWWYRGFSDAGLEVFLGIEHSYGAGPAKPGADWYQSWWQGRKTKETCDWKRTLFPFIKDNQHVIAGLFPINFNHEKPNYLARYFREQVAGAAHDDVAGPIPVWLWREGAFTPDSWKHVTFEKGDSASDYLNVLRDYSGAFSGK